MTGNPQWVKIRNVDGFNGGFWHGGVGLPAPTAPAAYSCRRCLRHQQQKPNTVIQQTNILANVELRVLVLKSHSIDGGAVKSKLRGWRCTG